MPDPGEGKAKSEIELSDILPASLQYLGLRECPDDESDLVVKMLQYGLRGFPNLRAVAISGSKLVEIQNLAEEMGIEWKPSLLQMDQFD